MPNYQRHVVYLSEAQKAELFENGTITVNGVTVTYSDNDVYVTPQDEPYIKPETGIPASDLADGVIPDIPVTDVQMNGTSVVSNKVANVPLASTSTAGVVRFWNGGGIGRWDSNGNMYIIKASDAAIKAGTNDKYPIVAEGQHKAVYYGLAKLAGADLANETVTVGTYPSTAKTAIQTMLDVPSNADMTSAINTAIGNINSFDIEIVQTLPTTGIKDHTIYFVPKTGTTNDVYDEYMYVNNAWEYLGSTQVDISGKADKVSSATSGNFAALDANGNLTDSGHKHSDYLTSAPVTDVQVDGTSVLSNGVANIPVAAQGVTGGVQVRSTGTYGLSFLQTSNASGQLVQSPELCIRRASNGEIKNGSGDYYPITASSQHRAVFYGLAKCAGDTTQGPSSNAIGVYTDSAKTAIRTMLDVPAVADLPVITGKADKVTSATSGNFASLDANGNLTDSGHKHADYLTVADSPVEKGTGASSVKIKDYGGSVTVASGIGACVFGLNNTASGSGSVIFGMNNAATQLCTTAVGTGNSAIAICAFAEGMGTKASSDYQHVQGKNNVEDANSVYAHIVGNGVNNEKSNAYSLTWTGDGRYAGDVYVNCNDDSTGGTKLATVDDIPDIATSADAQAIIDAYASA